MLWVFYCVFLFDLNLSYNWTHLNRSCHEFVKYILFVNGHTFSVPAVLIAGLMYSAGKRTTFELELSWLEDSWPNCKYFFHLTNLAFWAIANIFS